MSAQMLSRMQTMTSESSGASEGLSAASRILKPSDTFSGDDPMTFALWRFQFTSWLTFGSSQAILNSDQLSSRAMLIYHQDLCQEQRWVLNLVSIDEGI